MKTHQKTATLLSVALLLGTALAASAAEGSVNASPDGLAVKGYDVVSYFEDHRAAAGDPSITYRYSGATYRFVSASHRDLFAKQPQDYMPQYGGYCAFGTSKGHKADIDPESWAIVDGKLYLNSSKRAQALFDADHKSSIREADANWQKLK